MVSSKRRVPIGIAFFVLGFFVVILGSTSEITDVGFVGRLSLGGEGGIEVNSLFYFGITLIGVAVIILTLFNDKKGKK